MGGPIGKWVDRQVNGWVLGGSIDGCVGGCMH